MTTFLERMQRRYRLEASDATEIANKLHKYPEDAWELLSEWYYHQSLNIIFDSIDVEDVDVNEVQRLKRKYQTDDTDKALMKCRDYHDKRTHEIYRELDKKYPEIADNLPELVLDTFLIDKFDTWVHSDRVYNPSGDPLKKYLD